jgi:WD40 repeat protein
MVSPQSFQPGTARSGIFLSYARSDGAAFAAELRARLEAESVPLWQDRGGLEGGRDWWLQITEALDQVEFMALVLTPNALRSEIVRKEWRYARQQGVCVYPVLGDRNLDFSTLPRWLREVHIFDLSNAWEWNRFLHDINTRCRAPRVPFMAEDLPESFVPRPGELQKIIDLLRDPQGEEPIAGAVVLLGAGGFGKTTLARAVCHREEVQDAFDEGVLWVTLGQAPKNLVGLVEDLIYTLSGERPGFTDLLPATTRLGELLEGRDVLLVIDDVWNEAHLRPLLQGGPRCARLITTRNLDILPPGARRVDLESMRRDEAVALLAFELPEGCRPELQELAARLGEWPLLLSLVNGVLRYRVDHGQPLHEALAYARADLEENGLTAFDPAQPEERHQAVSSTLGVSLKLLEPEEDARFRELVVFPEDIEVPLVTVQKLWQRTGGLSPIRAEKLCDRLFRLSLLLSFDFVKRCIRLHDVVRKYLLHELAPALPALHAQLLEAHRPWPSSAGDSHWIALPAEEPYLWDHLADHLHEAGRLEELRKLLFDFRFLDTKLRAAGINRLIADFDAFGLEEEAHLVRGALRLAAAALASDESQLAGQLLGRLSGKGGGWIACLLRGAASFRRTAWLRPLFRSLTAPGGHLLCILDGHTWPVAAVGVIPGGHRIVSASHDRTLRVWDAESGQSLKTLAGHTKGLAAVAVLDERRAVSGSFDNTLRLWDLESGATLRILAGHTEGVRALAALDDRRIVSGSLDCTMRVWDLRTGETLQVLDGHAEGVCAIAAVGTDRIVSASYDRTLLVWDLETGTVVRKLTGHTDRVRAMAVLDGGRLVSASLDGTLRVWDLETGETLRELRGAGYPVRAVTALDDRRIVSASEDDRLTVWNLESGKAVRTFEGHRFLINALAALDDRRVVSAAWDSTLRVWEIETDHEVPSHPGHTDSIQALTALEDGRFLSASEDNTLRLWDTGTGESGTILESPAGLALAVAALDRRHVLSSHSDGTLWLWDLETRESRQVLQGPAEGIGALALLDGSRVLGGARDGTVRVWELASGSTLQVLAGHGTWVEGVARLDDRRAVSASWDGTLRVWDLQTGTTVQVLTGHRDRVSQVVVVDSRSLVSVSLDAYLRLWDVERGETVRVLEGHVGGVSSGVLLDGGRLASASYDRTVRVWDLATGRNLATLSLDSPVLATAVNADGVLAVGDGLGQVHFLRLVAS